MIKKILSFLLVSIVPSILFMNDISKFYSTPVAQQGERLKYLLIALVWITSIFVIAFLQFGYKKTSKKRRVNFYNPFESPMHNLIFDRTTDKNSKISTFKIFMLFCLMYWLFNLLADKLIATDNLYINSLSNQFNFERIVKIMQFQRKWEWLGYVLIPLFLLIKISFTSSCIFIATYMDNLNIRFYTIFKISLLSEIIFIISALVHFAYFLIFPAANFEEITNFSPLSIAQLLNNHFEKYLQYTFQSLNIFEIVYWILLAKGVEVYSNLGFTKSFGIVAKSYGIGLLIWVIVATFLILQYT